MHTQFKFLGTLTLSDSLSLCLFVIIMSQVTSNENIVTSEDALCTPPNQIMRKALSVPVQRSDNMDNTAMLLTLFPDSSQESSAECTPSTHVSVSQDSLLTLPLPTSKNSSPTVVPESPAASSQDSQQTTPVMEENTESPQTGSSSQDETSVASALQDSQQTTPAMEENTESPQPDSSSHDETYAASVSQDSHQPTPAMKENTESPLPARLLVTR